MIFILYLLIISVVTCIVGSWCSSAFTTCAILIIEFCLPVISYFFSFFSSFNLFYYPKSLPFLEIASFFFNNYYILESLLPSAIESLFSSFSMCLSEVSIINPEFPSYFFGPFAEVSSIDSWDGLLMILNWCFSGIGTSLSLLFGELNLPKWFWDSSGYSLEFGLLEIVLIPFSFCALLYFSI